MLDAPIVLRCTFRLLISYSFSSPGGLSTTAIVLVQVMDVNDNRPVFSPWQYNVTLRSDNAVSGPVLRVLATDKDVGHFGLVAYRISGGNEAGIFRIDRSSGELHVARYSHLSRTQTHHLNITATDAAGLKSLKDAEVRITVSSPGNRLAACERPRYSISVEESVAQNSIIGNVKAAPDSGKHSFFSTLYQYLCIIRDRDSFNVYCNWE